MSRNQDLLIDLTPGKNGKDVEGYLCKGSLAGIHFSISAQEGAYLGADSKLEASLIKGTEALKERGVSVSPDSAPIGLYRANNGSLVISGYDQEGEPQRVELDYKGWEKQEPV